MRFGPAGCRLACDRSQSVATCCRPPFVLRIGQRRRMTDLFLGGAGRREEPSQKHVNNYFNSFRNESSAPVMFSNRCLTPMTDRLWAFERRANTRGLQRSMTSDVSVRSTDSRLASTPYAVYIGVLYHSHPRCSRCRDRFDSQPNRRFPDWPHERGDAAADKPRCRPTQGSDAPVTGAQSNAISALAPLAATVKACWRKRWRDGTQHCAPDLRLVEDSGTVLSGGKCVRRPSRKFNSFRNKSSACMRTMSTPAPN